MGISSRDDGTDAHPKAVMWVIGLNGAMGVITIMLIGVLAIALVTGFKPKGASAEIQKDLALVTIGALLTIPGSVINGLFSLLGKTNKTTDTGSVSIANTPDNPVPTEVVNP